MILEKTKLIFFGTDEFAVAVLATLLERGLRPALIVTTPDKPAGRKSVMTSPAVKSFALKNKLEFIQLDKLKEALPDLQKLNPDLALVASYGKILPREVIDLPKHGTLNIHPSLLPAFRGPAPIQNTILAGATPGVTIMVMDEEVDHGPIIKSGKLKVESGKTYPELRDGLARFGAELFLEIMPKWLAGEIKPIEQDHAKATFTKKINKEDGEIRSSDDPNLNYRKFLAYTPWPGTYFFHYRHGKKIRVIVKEAHLSDDKFIIVRVLPEGKKEMSWEDFLRG